VLALRKQIAAAGHVLVKEYIDNGFSGPRFDRPALNEMRKDVRTDLFDAIYFHDADRIAREVTIQTIVIEEILKHRKQLIINGKDYVKNPENKFTLTVLGAVAELERAKIIERVFFRRAARTCCRSLVSTGRPHFLPRVKTTFKEVTATSRPLTLKGRTSALLKAFKAPVGELHFSVFSGAPSLFNIVFS
jgi:hypothetical protein